MKLIPEIEPDDGKIDVLIGGFRPARRTREEVEMLRKRGIHVETGTPTRKPPEKNPRKGARRNGHSPAIPVKTSRKRGFQNKCRGFTKDEQARGASAGGKARAKKMTKAQRSESARNAVLARWGRKAE